MFLVDIYWLVMPSVPEAALEHATSWDQLATQATQGTLPLGWNPSVLDLTTLVGMLGLVVAGTFLYLGRAALAPTHDPRLPEALAFENF